MASEGDKQEEDNIVGISTPSRCLSHLSNDALHVQRAEQRKGRGKREVLGRNLDVYEAQLLRRKPRVVRQLGGSPVVSMPYPKLKPLALRFQGKEDESLVPHGAKRCRDDACQLHGRVQLQLHIGVDGAAPVQVCSSGAG
eukprot:524378-Hanusia_phi.AAC.7